MYVVYRWGTGMKFPRMTGIFPVAPWAENMARSCIRQDDGFQYVVSYWNNGSEAPFWLNLG